MKKIGMVSLGCDKNRVDSEIMLYNLKKGGFEITPDPSEADIIIVNTCAFIESARVESIDTILEMAKFKQQNCKQLIVTGCLPQKYINEIFDEFQEVDGFLGTNDYEKIVDFLNELKNRNFLVSKNMQGVEEGGRILTTDSHYAYLRVSDGCDNHCTYCTIPSIRGKYRSRTIESICAEAEELANNGVKELILVAQDLTKYGFDLYKTLSLVPLIQKLSKISGIVWIRLLYCYPELINDELIHEIATNDKVVKYIDIPLQHSENKILKLMGRRSSKENIISLIEKLRENVPNIAIRSTFIVGFPNENDADVEGLKNFLKVQKLSNVGFFEYSKEEGTPAGNMENQIPTEIKKKHLSELAFVQSKVVKNNNSFQVGKVYNAFVDSLVVLNKEKNTYSVRSEFIAPSIDGCIFVTTEKTLSIGDYIMVKITAFSDYDLIGEIYEFAK